MSSSRSYADVDLKLLWGRAAARCSFPECHVECTAEPTPLDPAVVLGEIAHIVARSDAGPRGDPALPEDQRDRYPNLILLCAHHHVLVDKQANSFTSANLREWKERHEAWVYATLAARIADVGFAELEVVTRGLLAMPNPPTQDLIVVPPKEKMDRNGLTRESFRTLSLGLIKAREVAEFLDRTAANLDPDFPERLRAGFVARYHQEKAAGLVGDGLFEAMRAFAAPPRLPFSEQTAGVAVLAYLFESCEVFER